MARAASGLGVRELAERAGVTANTISRIENGADAKQSTLDALQRVLEEWVVFIAEGQQADGGAGVRLKTGFEPKIKLASDGPHRGAYQRYVGGAPLLGEDDKK